LLRLGVGFNCFLSINIGSAIPDSIKTKVVADEKLFVNSDSAYVRRALTNLIANAVQAMPTGGNLTIQAQQNKEAATLSVEDSGVGIPEEVKPNLFIPLFTTKAKGQGLGLAVVKRLIEAMDGSVSFESQVGNGTTFTITLPSDA
jgi:two-component system, NtrC family, sensor kinase